MFRIASSLERMIVKNIKKITYLENQPLKNQINSLKLLFIENKLILGKKFTIKMTTLIIQIEKLTGFYDSKKLGARFNSHFKTLELRIFEDDLTFIISSSLLNELNLIKQKFSKAVNNSEKKKVMFELLFFHLNCLFEAYQSLEPQINLPKLDESIENKSLLITNLQKSPDENEILSKLTPKQGKSYLILKNN